MLTRTVTMTVFTICVAVAAPTFAESGKAAQQATTAIIAEPTKAVVDVSRATVRPDAAVIPGALTLALEEGRTLIGKRLMR